MGGGLAGHELAAAVSAAGGLGMIGFLAPAQLSREIAAARALTAAPLAVNLLLPFARSAHFQVAAEADAVVTFWGRPVRRTPRIWLHQCGSVQEALLARAAGADGVILQGVEAGGHVRGKLPAAELLRAARGALPDDYPLLSAGGIAVASDASARLAAGAAAVVCGTRFLASEESRAHPLYKQRLLTSRETVLTELFGLGWPAPHRVLENEATARWLAAGRRGPAWLRGLQRASGPLLARGPMQLQLRLAAAQRARAPFFGPLPASAEGSPELVEAGPLYAGECVRRIENIQPAGGLVRDLSPRA
jgi:NAD(P)H-dependent flavin oxidoreductase YrpB (nitropropane dioxygenase family)